MAITESRIEQALVTIATTDNEYAEARGTVLRSEYMVDCAESLAFAQLEGSIEERKRAVKLIPEVKAAHEEFFKASVIYENLKARRQREYVIIEIWRSQESSRRAGLIT